MSSKRVIAGGNGVISADSSAVFYWLLFILLISSKCLFAEEPYQIGWIAQQGTEAYDVSNAISVDGLDNICIAGYTRGTLDGISGGGSDVFVSQYDCSGTRLWTQQLSSNGDDECWGFAADDIGNKYICGNTYELGRPSNGSHDIFLGKLDIQGEVQWIQQFGTTEFDRAQDMTVDTWGNVLVAGYTYGGLAGTHAGLRDAFLSKYDNNGNHIWTRQFGTSGEDRINGVTTDDVGNVFVCGHTGGALDDIYSGSYDVFLRKYDSSGNLLWGNQFGTSSLDYANGIALDGLGDIYITGATSGQLGDNIYGGEDAFVSKFTSDGDYSWTKQLGTAGIDKSQDIVIDSLGSLFLCGETTGSLGGPNAGWIDLFLSKLDSEGNLLWNQQLGSSAQDISFGIDLDSIDRIYLGGRTGGSLGGPSWGDYDAFLVQYVVPEPGTVILLVLGIPLLRKKPFENLSHACS